MDNPIDTFRNAVHQLAGDWISSGLPSHQAVDQAADRLLSLRDKLGIQGLWALPPVMVTATLDDGLGQGLAVIEKYATTIGMRLVSLGLMQTPEAVIAACHREQPDFLGMTVLQFDSEDDLIVIAANLPRRTRIVAGGPVFSGDPEFAERTGTHYAAKHVAYFLRFMLDSV
jgi:methylmalonyl-CoA mutase cobalamin-binding subunit